VTIGPAVREALQVSMTTPEDVLMEESPLIKSLIQGCLGALKRGSLGSYQTANIQCHIMQVDAEGGLPYLTKVPGTLRAAAAHAIADMLKQNKDVCKVLEPTMKVELSVPSSMVGPVLSDFTGRRGSIDEVLTGSESTVHSKTLVRGDVPLTEILGYANLLRSLTGGEGVFTAEYKGHSPVSS
jgi:elongation factor G